MMKLKKKFLWIFLFLVFLALVIISLEVLSRNRQCKTFCTSVYCIDLPDFSSVEISSQNSLSLAELKDKRSNGEKISKEEYRQAADNLIIEIDPEVLGGCYNGKSCGRVGYVRNDLPSEAKKFVKRHELEHLLQTRLEKNREFLANLAAGREYPLGLLQTIFFSLQNRFKYQESLLCYALTTWKTFKVYFLP